MKIGNRDTLVLRRLPGEGDYVPVRIYRSVVYLATTSQQGDIRIQLEQESVSQTGKLGVIVPEEKGNNFIEEIGEKKDIFFLT